MVSTGRSGDLYRTIGLNSTYRTNSFKPVPAFSLDKEAITNSKEVNREVVDLILVQLKA
jgi:hypothetical protein